MIMQPDDPNEEARRALRDQAMGRELEDEPTYPADDIHGNTELEGTDQPGGVSEVTGGDEEDEIGGRPSEDGDADSDADETNTGHDRE
jgi:hypothetical protein